MCGISALFTNKGLLSGDHLQDMTELIRHRGPDDEGYFVAKGPADRGSQLGGRDSQTSLDLPSIQKVTTFRVGLGHRRLSIIDPSPLGHQPFCSPEGRYWITYNGEIYNYLELRSELEGQGITFSTHCDTEVLLQAYLFWGSSCLSRLNGMFAFVVYDCVTGEIFAARDRFGVKPLYYWYSSSGFLALASEVKQFVCLPGWSPTLHGQAAFDFLQWGLTAHLNETHFAGVYQVRGGEYLSARLEDLPEFETRQWYKPTVTACKLPFDQAGDHLRTLLEDAVRLRLRSDVSVGSCLSGGLDSSSIVCLMRQLQGTELLDLNAFSACVHGGPLDESPYMDEINQFTSSQPHRTYPSLDALWDQLDSIVWHQDEPFGSTSIFAQWEVFGLAKRQGVKVLLDGQGADECFAGYQAFWGPYLRDVWKHEGWSRWLREMKACKQSQGINPYLALLRSSLPNSLKGYIKKYLLARESSFLNFSLLEVEQLNPHLDHFSSHSAVNQLCTAQVGRTNLPMLLHYEDRDSMAHSVESRTPFVDYRVVEYGLGLPYHYKLGNGFSKRILRQAMKGVLPERVRNRVDKLGFVTPEENWLRKEQPERFKKEVQRAIDSSQGLLNQGALELVQGVIEGRKRFSFLPWRILVFGRWMERFGCRVG